MTMKKETTLAEKIVGYGIVWPIISTLLWWYNHVWIHPVLPFWQWMILALIGLWAMCFIKGTMNRVMPILFFASLTVQLLSWFKVIVLPVIK